MDQREEEGRQEAAEPTAGEPEDVYTSDEEQEVAARLQALGYLD